MKPILFNTDMVRAILDGRKTVTRRVEKKINPEIPCQCQGRYDHEFIRDDFCDGVYTGFVCRKCGYGVSPPHGKYPVGTSCIRPPYSPGDILYVRETWGDYATENDPGAGYYMYRADYPDGATTAIHPDGTVFELPRWRPSIHMPKKAARIFLRVTDVWAERLQDMTDEQCARDGGYAIEAVKAVGVAALFAPLWDSTIKKPADRNLYGWAANPWVWVIGFERISREEDRPC